jgi:hypothetical protein
MIVGIVRGRAALIRRRSSNRFGNHFLTLRQRCMNQLAREVVRRHIEPIKSILTFLHMSIIFLRYRGFCRRYGRLRSG